MTLFDFVGCIVANLGYPFQKQTKADGLSISLNILLTLIDVIPPKKRRGRLNWIQDPTKALAPFTTRGC